MIASVYVPAIRYVETSEDTGEHEPEGVPDRRRLYQVVT